MKKYYIYWRSKITGVEGHGTKALSREDAQSWIEEAERNCPYIEHWLVEAR